MKLTCISKLVTPIPLCWMMSKSHPQATMILMTNLTQILTTPNRLRKRCALQNNGIFKFSQMYRFLDPFLSFMRQLGPFYRTSAGEKARQPSPQCSKHMALKLARKGLQPSSWGKAGNRASLPQLSCWRQWCSSPEARSPYLCTTELGITFLT